ncbi:ComF family protein [Acutalibacter sp. 1XD8-33]|uniref:ComF family protein n=1 Tax=Acutalibacter sp. 1XD8-33 TaxID=2320081 RepID=UPI000EA01AA9|nr:ComF family protein [Acutalibacter sp. 1XD8-33]RKJ40968.1 ComF family protein [Acutalibacter sp. 1XD8-33]
MITRYPVSWTSRLLGLLFPSHCLLCGKNVRPGELFCPDCAASPPQSPCRRVISLPDGGEMPVLSPFPYEEGYRNTLHEFKFRGRTSLAQPLGFLMAQEAREFPNAFSGVVFVPLHKTGRRKRGYDQSRLLAEAMAWELGLPVTAALEKIRLTQTQHELNPGEREKNVLGAYAVKKGADIDGRHLLLVDDIVTTGNTLRQCAQELFAAGARSVCAVCAADADKKLKLKGA